MKIENGKLRIKERFPRQINLTAMTTKKTFCHYEESSDAIILEKETTGSPHQVRDDREEKEIVKGLCTTGINRFGNGGCGCNSRCFRRHNGIYFGDLRRAD